MLSDHGQTQGHAFTDRFGESVEQLVGRLCGGDPQPDRSDKRAARRPPSWQVGAALAEASTGAGPVARRLRARVERTRPGHPRTATGAPGAVTRVAPGSWSVSSGHVAMVSFAEHAGPGRAGGDRAGLPRSAARAGRPPRRRVPLVRTAEHGPVVLGRDGVHRLATGVVLGDDPLVPYGRTPPPGRAGVDGFRTAPTSWSTAATTRPPTRRRRSSRMSGRTAGWVARSPRLPAAPRRTARFGRSRGG